MNIELKFNGGTIVEIVCSDHNTTMTNEITNLWGVVDEDFIYNLEIIVEDLKNHNKEINERDK